MSNRCEFTIYCATTSNNCKITSGVRRREPFSSNWRNSDEDWRVEKKTYWLRRFANIWITLDKSVARGVARAAWGGQGRANEKVMMSILIKLYLRLWAFNVLRPNSMFREKWNADDRRRTKTHTMTTPGSNLSCPKQCATRIHLHDIALCTKIYRFAYCYKFHLAHSNTIRKGLTLTRCVKFRV